MNIEDERRTERAFPPAAQGTRCTRRPFASKVACQCPALRCSMFAVGCACTLSFLTAAVLCPAQAPHLLRLPAVCTRYRVPSCPDEPSYAVLVLAVSVAALRPHFVRWFSLCATILWQLVSLILYPTVRIHRASTPRYTCPLSPQAARDRHGYLPTSSRRAASLRTYSSRLVRLASSRRGRASGLQLIVEHIMG